MPTPPISRPTKNEWIAAGRPGNYYDWSDAVYRQRAAADTTRQRLLQGAAVGAAVVFFLMRR